MSFNVEFDTRDIENALASIENIIQDKIQSEYAQALADQLISNILELINEGEWESSTGGPVYGIVDSGEYKGSWDSVYIEDSILVGSIDDKARKIEDGTEPSDHADLKDEEIIAWCKRNGISPPTKIGRIIASNIREFGIPPKPVLRQALAKLKTQNDAVKREVIRAFQTLN